MALRKKGFFPWLITLLLFLLFSISHYVFSDTPSNPQENGLRKVVRVVDGDTLVLSPDEKIRLIGVNTPETKHPKKPVECFGQQAKEFTKKMVSGKKMRLEFDEVNRALGHKDRYGRTLAYVYLDDGTFLNAEIIRQGYGHAYTGFPFRYLEQFRSLERQARRRGTGLWLDCYQ